MTSLRILTFSCVSMALGAAVFATPAAANKTKDLEACRAAIAVAAGVAEDDYRFKIDRVRKKGGASNISFDIMPKRGVEGADYSATCKVRSGEVMETAVEGA